MIIMNDIRKILDQVSNNETDRLTPSDSYNIPEFILEDWYRRIIGKLHIIPSVFRGITLQTTQTYNNGLTSDKLWYPQIYLDKGFLLTHLFDNPRYNNNVDTITHTISELISTYNLQDWLSFDISIAKITEYATKPSFNWFLIQTFYSITLLYAKKEKFKELLNSFIAAITNKAGLQEIIDMNRNNDSVYTDWSGYYIDYINLMNGIFKTSVGYNRDSALDFRLDILKKIKTLYPLDYNTYAVEDLVWTDDIDPITLDSIIAPRLEYGINAEYYYTRDIVDKLSEFLSSVLSPEIDNNTGSFSFDQLLLESNDTYYKIYTVLDNIREEAENL